MNMLWVCLAVLVLAATVGMTAPLRPEKTLARLEAGQPVTVVGFGDSITGIYYHTGGRRAWPEMLGLALQRLYPAAPVKVINAGQSGDDTAGALKRLDAQVLAHRPDLVVVMFGMNDITRVPAETYAANLKAIVARCRAAGAEVALCTPNAIMPGDGGRPESKLAQYAALVREVATAEGTPLVDCFQAYAELRGSSPLSWRLLMSDAIHPNMRGHKVFAQEMVRVLTGRSAEILGEPPLKPAIPHTLSLLDKGQPVKVLAMAPADALLAPALQALKPGAEVIVTSWQTAGLPLAKLEAAAKTVRGQEPDLVVIAVPAAADAPTLEAFIASYTWVLNWSLSFGVAEWDGVALMPAVLDPSAQAGDFATGVREGLTREVLAGQDIGWLDRQPGDTRPAAELLAEWLAAQKP